ncbi:MAG TPA: T9SS type A sorting domain-containing protein [Candidatus Coatesbacteria bacterium]|nr:T9SS type A sorting domain-containing protein [Candidatus Coatesbacteria bacterium]
MKKMIAALLLLPAMVLAHGWSAPVAIADYDTMEQVAGSGSRAHLVDEKGVLHFVFFSDFEEPGNTEVYYMKLERGVWSEPLRLSHGQSFSNVPTMTMDGRGNITVAWYDYRLDWPYGDLFWCRYDAASQTWSSDEPLVVSKTWHSLYPHMVAEPGGKVHLVFCDGPAVWPLHFQLHYAYWEDGQWSEPVPLTNVATGNRWMPVFRIDDSGTLHLFWGDDRTAWKDWHVYYKTRSPSGVWSEEVFLGPGMPHGAVITKNGLLFLSRTSVQEMAGLGIWDADEGDFTQLKYSVKSLLDPNDVWLLEEQPVTPLGQHYASQGALAESYSGVRLVWVLGVKGHHHIYQASVGLHGMGAPELVSSLIGSNRTVSLSSGPRGDLHLIYAYSTDELDWDIYYRYDAVRRGGGAAGDESRIALQYVLPNPASDGATVSLLLPSAGEVEVALYDTAGRRVGTVFSGGLAAGRHELPVDTAGLRSGTYFIRAAVDGGSDSVPLVVVR